MMILRHALKAFAIFLFTLIALGGPVLAESAGIEMNGTKRWTVVPAMMTHFQAMESALGNPVPTDLKGHRQLATKLQASLDALVANCTMSGQAHDELHKWLVPFMTSVKAYAGTADLATLKKEHASLKQTFVTFHRYFQ